MTSLDSVKKVAVLCNTLLPGSQTFIKEQVTSLSRWRATLVGYCIDSDGLPLNELDYRLVFGKRFNNMQWQAVRYCQLFRAPYPPTVRAVKAIEPQVVHIHFGTHAVLYWPSIRKVGMPVLVTLHGYDINRYREWWESGGGGPSQRHYPRELLRLAGDPHVLFVAVSEE